MLNRQVGSTRNPKDRLHSALLTLNLLNTSEQNTPPAERHWVVERTIELNQPVYIKDILTSECKKLEISTGKEKLLVPSKLTKIRHDKGRPPEDLVTAK